MASRQLDQREWESESAVLSAGSIRLNHDTRRIDVAGRRIDLNHQEFELLDALMRSPNCVIPTARLCSTLWGLAGSKETKRLAVVVSHLRAKLGVAGPCTIDNVRHRGYSLIA